ncbi:FtsX-like permease family protein [Mucilaginibacter sp. UR6-11]|uniref:ABC transporter permease n=1 Tax=Mucilaginibacter sp. UR6-11 TaxID=1435644 RepID=UPI001E3874F3|nr:FtsX-like permease family protein [Mucilaginibacter sp. UR6-11]MCC8423842.1 ABC transporter permease [Mucilaginibacter sp. UR6-11]
MNFASFIAGRISFKSKRTFSKLIVRIAIVGIVLGLGVMILSLAIIRGFKNEILEKVRGFDGDIKVVKYDLNGSYENSPFVKADTFVNKVKGSRAILHIMPFATKPGIIKAHNEIEGVVLKGVDSTYSWDFLRANLVAGTVINFKDTTESKRQLMISQTTANRLKLKLGDNLMMYFVQQPMRRRPFKVVGIFDTSIEDIDKIYVIGDLSLLKRLNNWKADEIGGYQLTVADFEKIDEVGYFVDNNLPPRLKFTTVFENFPLIFEWLPLLDINARVMLILMLAVAVINMISALLIMILERTAMIGILKAMGATNWSIQKVFLYNASYIIGLGLIFGNALGLGLSILQYKTHVFKLDASSYYMSFVPIQTNWADIVFLNIGTMAICLLVLIVPSMLVSKISPVKAIRFK